MINGLSSLPMYLSYPFVRWALISGVLIAMCASMLGSTLVLKRFSFIGDGLAHVAFGAIAVSAVAGLTQNMYIVLPMTVASAVLLLKTGQRSKIRGDASLAMISAGSMAIGYLLINKFSPTANVSGDVCGTLFGSATILTLGAPDVLFCAVLSLVVTALFLLTYNKIFAVTFDEDFAAAAGVNTRRVNLLIAIMIAVVTVMGMSFVGTLLISGLVVFPALSAMRVFSGFRAVVICAVIIAVFSAVAGIIAAIVFATPVGATIVVADILMFLIFSLIGARTARA